MSKSDDDYLWDKSGDADPDVARLEQLLSPLAHSAPLDELRMRRKSKVPLLIAFGMVAVAAAIVVVIVWPRSGATPPPENYACGAQATGFAFTARGGSVACGGATVPAGVLPVGGTLDTGANEADLAIADIGSAQLSPKTRVRLDATSPERHQLYLERGRMHAFVSAPPRLFAVGTPSGQVTDLGCAYTLEIDESGAGSIEVESGMVELEVTNGRVIVVPAGASARLLAGRRASLPLAKGANAQLVAAVGDFHAGVANARDRVLATAQPSDAITVANLARITSPGERRSVLDRLAELAKPPQDMSVDDIEQLDLLDMWFDEIVFGYIAAH
ncbi:MAG: FecR domain-containing protein [Myxococcota bacterium]|nr:FecR domain-containing protein [Myxococcota bacterium]